MNAPQWLQLGDETSANTPAFENASVAYPYGAMNFHWLAISYTGTGMSITFFLQCSVLPNLRYGESATLSLRIINTQSRRLPLSLIAGSQYSITKISANCMEAKIKKALAVV
jgi:hypothetical protein